MLVVEEHGTGQLKPAGEFYFDVPGARGANDAANISSDQAKAAEDQRAEALARERAGQLSEGLARLKSIATTAERIRASRQ